LKLKAFHKKIIQKNIASKKCLSAAHHMPSAARLLFHRADRGIRKKPVLALKRGGGRCFLLGDRGRRAVTWSWPAASKLPLPALPGVRSLPPSSKSFGQTPHMAMPSTAQALKPLLGVGKKKSRIFPLILAVT